MLSKPLSEEEVKFNQVTCHEGGLTALQLGQEILHGFHCLSDFYYFVSNMVSEAKLTRELQ